MRWLLATAALVLGVSGTMGAVALAASGPRATLPPNAPTQQKQLFAACHASVVSMRKAVTAAPSKRITAIRSQLAVSTPGTLTGKLAFNRSASQITFSADGGLAGAAAVTRSTTYTCGAGATNRPGLGPGTTQVVSTVTRTFTTPGVYTVTFQLNAIGQHILGQVAKADRGYRRHNPHGTRPPTIAVGVSLAYTSTS